VNSSFFVRLMSGAVLVVITFLCNHFGGTLIWLEALFISLVGLYEFSKTVDITNNRKSKNNNPSINNSGKRYNLLTIVLFLATLIYYAIGYCFGDKYAFFIVIITFVALMAVYVFTFPKFEAQNIAYSIMGFVYVPVMISFMYFTRSTEYGIYAVWLIYIASWCCDTGAYCVGVLFGKHKMAPILSPKKSIEGAIGGTICSGLVGYLFGLFVENRLQIDSSTPVIFMVICLVGAIISQTGDLAASAIKRNHEIKDYGNLIPGHGGILDRYDSVIFTAPMIYFLLTLFMK